MSKYTKPAGPVKNAGFVCNPYSLSDTSKGVTGSASGATEKSNPNPYSFSHKKG